MEKILEKLEFVLNKEEESHLSFLKLAKELNKALRENNITEIERLRKLYDESICYIEKLEEERLSCCVTLKELLGIKTSQINISTLINLVPEKWKQKFFTIKNNMKKIIDELASITTSNRILIEEGIKVMNASILNIYKLNNRYSCYKRSGKNERNYFFNGILNKTV
ncbi:MAG: hypothetical protein N2053_00410 [Chitinispirillaceae bacterium]|nr:hypothetical protein [Chitinispirillaceae bacterium]